MNASVKALYNDGGLKTNSYMFCIKLGFRVTFGYYCIELITFLYFLAVLTDADTRILFLEKNSLHELLCLIEDFLIEGKVLFKSIVPTETSPESDMRNNSFLDGVDTLSSEVASSEQLVAASIILASICAATDYVGFISEASYNILRLCRWDSSTVLTILHIFANLGGRMYFDLGNSGLMVTVLKSLVMFLEEGSISVTTASCLPSINQLHTELCANFKCPFSEGVQSIDIVTSLLLEKIKNCLFQQAKQFDSSNFRFLSDNYNVGLWSNQEGVSCANSMNCDTPCCLKEHVACPTQPDVVTLCQISDVLSLLELVANKMVFLLCFQVNSPCFINFSLFNALILNDSSVWQEFYFPSARLSFFGNQPL